MTRRSMNSPKGKEILSLVRNGDFAHPGEGDAVKSALSRFLLDPARRVLDVGCGRGGTAALITNLGYGIVSGFDSDSESIDYARLKYPHLDLQVSDAVDCAAAYGRTFDIISLFSVYYILAPEEQGRCLAQLRQLSHQGTSLVIFDYVVKRTIPASIVPSHRSHWNPICLDEFSEVAAKNGWNLLDFVDYTPEFKEWYSVLVERIELKKDDIFRISDAEWFAYTKTRYIELLCDITSNSLFGGAVYLVPVSTGPAK